MISTQRFAQVTASSLGQYQHGMFVVPDDFPKEGLRDRWQNGGAGEYEFSQVCAPAPYAFRVTNPCPVLLQISSDPGLAKSRSGLLETIGFEVVMASGAETLGSLLADKPAVLFICQTIEAKIAHAVREYFHARGARLQVIRAVRHAHVDSDGYDLVLQSPVSPEVFVQEMTKVYRSFQDGRVSH